MISEDELPKLRAKVLIDLGNQTTIIHSAIVEKFPQLNQFDHLGYALATVMHYAPTLFTLNEQKMIKALIAHYIDIKIVAEGTETKELKDETIKDN